MQESDTKIRCRWSSTLGDLEGTAQETWGTVPYNPDTDRDLPCVFFGLYGLPDFYTLWRHKGKKWILWAGTDILHFANGYWLKEGGEMNIHPLILAPWINEFCESWCENVAEQRLLQMFGINAKVCPSFLGDTAKFKVDYKHSKNPVVYASVSGDNFKQYGWDVIERVASKVPDITFMLYGNRAKWRTKNPNVYVMGRVPKDTMNFDIKTFQSGIRPLEFDGASEILIKAVLMGQYPVSRIPYPHMLNYETEEELVKQLKRLKTFKKPNLKGRKYYLKNLNKFPWIKK